MNASTKIAAFNADQITAIRMALINTEGKFRDDHNNSREFSTYKQFAVLQQGDKISICPIPAAPYSGNRFIISLNPLYLKEEGQLHLSTRSIHTFDQLGMDLEQAVENFNNEYRNHQWGQAEITEIIKI